MKTLIRNAIVLTPFRRLPQGITVIVENGRIAALTDDKIDESDFDGKIVDAAGLYLAPGFIDTHTHGAGGSDFLDGSTEAILNACRTHMNFGTTSIVPTILSSDQEEAEACLSLMDDVRRNGTKIPNIIGVHMEGPYFSQKQNGAQDANYLKLPDPNEYVTLLEKFPFIVKWTVAPELPGALAMGRYLSGHGVVASIGHSNGTESDVIQAIENGYSMVTHLYNGMSYITRSSAKIVLGIAESTLLYDELTAEIIADGCHLPPELLRLIIKAKGIDRVCLVTDSMRAAGTEEKSSILGSIKHGQQVEIENGVAYMPSHRSFGGSICTADRLIRTMHEKAGLSLENALQMLTANPAKTLNIYKQKGSITINKDADIILFDENINIKFVMVMGDIWKNQTDESQQ